MPRNSNESLGIPIWACPYSRGRPGMATGGASTRVAVSGPRAFGAAPPTKGGTEKYLYPMILLRCYAFTVIILGYKASGNFPRKSQKVLASPRKSQGLCVKQFPSKLRCVYSTGEPLQPWPSSECSADAASCSADAASCIWTAKMLRRHGCKQRMTRVVHLRSAITLSGQQMACTRSSFDCWQHLHQTSYVRPLDTHA